MSATFPELLTAAHRKGDEIEVDRLLDVQASVRAEITERIAAANDAAANLAHQLHALDNLLRDAVAQEMSVEDGSAPLLTAIGVATFALQEWAER